MPRNPLTESRSQWVRDLSPEECDRLGFDGPLALCRREMRFVLGPWRPTRTYVVSHRRHGDVLVVDRAELRHLGVEP